jgi:hypothetical protein
VLKFLLNSAYFAICALTVFAGVRGRNQSLKTWWFALATGMLAIGLLRTADASLWTDFYLQRALAEMNVYGGRRPLQLLGIIAFGLMLVLFVRQRPKRRPKSLDVAIWAFSGLALFAAIRISSWHWSDALLERQIARMTASYAIQFSLLAVLAAAAASDLLRKTDGKTWNDGAPTAFNNEPRDLHML